VEQLSIIGQIIEKKINKDFWKAYDSIYRESLYKIMEEFVIDNKMVTIIKMCMDG